MIETKNIAEIESHRVKPHHVTQDFNGHSHSDEDDYKGKLEEYVPRYYVTALKMVNAPNGARPLAQMLMVLLIITILIMVFVPWQQNVGGSGIVTSFIPEKRPQTIEAVIDGQVLKWNVSEGDFVKKGDTIALLRDIDTKFLDPQFARRQEVIRDNEVGEAELDIISGQQKVIQEKEKFSAAQADVNNVNVDVFTARIQFERAKSLVKEGLIAQKDYESALIKLQKEINDSVKAQTSLNVAFQSVLNAETELQAKRRKASAKVAKADLDLGNVDARKSFSVVISPIEGYIARINRAGLGQTVKKNERLALVVPVTDDIAAEIYVGGLDAAIIDTGKPVRLQFAGFPAVQAFGAGLPRVAIGTFGGIVKVVDAVDDGTGRFRVLVIPDPKDQPWPERSFLRQGTDVSGWILLNEVPVGYELWRIACGFPPFLPVKQNKDKKKTESGLEETKK
ncbi:MAG: biotin/lipoyl-binding protein [Chloroherpetonaceae bacterium]|nr:biotin/lipoyl-binding protein [Chloroherpetonaceae bacterium]